MKKIHTICVTLFILVGPHDLVGMNHLKNKMRNLKRDFITLHYFSKFGRSFNNKHASFSEKFAVKGFWGAAGGTIAGLAAEENYNFWDTCFIQKNGFSLKRSDDYDSLTCFTAASLATAGLLGGLPGIAACSYKNVDKYNKFFTLNQKKNV